MYIIYIKPNKLGIKKRRRKNDSGDSVLKSLCAYMQVTMEDASTLKNSLFCSLVCILFIPKMAATKTKWIKQRHSTTLVYEIWLRSLTCFNETLNVQF